MKTEQNQVYRKVTIEEARELLVNDPAFQEFRDVLCEMRLKVARKRLAERMAKREHI